MSTAESGQQRRLLQVQALDTRARQLAHRRRSLPESAHLAELDTTLKTLTDDQIRARTAVGDLERALRRAEADVEQVRVRAARDNERLNSGATSAKDLIGLQHELQTLARRQSDLEDAELEVMEQLETATAEYDSITARLQEGREREAQLVAARDLLLAEIATEEAQLATDRVSALQGLDASLVTLYERVREHTGGVAAAELVSGRCGGCRVELSAKELAGFKAARPDEVVQCEECRCILVHAES
jgi:predicted  nucleic acid-binding Zn-ribbon protein